MSVMHDKALRALDMSRQGMSWEDIGEVLGWSPSTAQSMTSRVKRWDYHRQVQSLREKRTRVVYRGRGKKLSGVNWNPEMEDALRSLWPLQTGDRIARILSLQYGVNLTRNATIAKARRLKLPPKAPYRPGWPNRGLPDEQRERAPFG